MGVQNTWQAWCSTQGSEPPRRWVFRRQCTADLLGQLRGKTGFHSKTIFSGHVSLQLSAAVKSGYTDSVCAHVCLLQFRASGLSLAVRCVQLQGSEQQEKDPEFPKGWQGCCLTHPSSCLFSAQPRRGHPGVNLSIPSSPCQPDQPASHQGTLHTRRRAWGDRCPGPTWLPASSGACHLLGVPGRPPPLWGPCVLQDGLPLGAIDLLAANEVAGGVGKVDETGLAWKSRARGFMEFSMGIICFPLGNLGPYVHAPDDARPALAIHKEQLVFWL